MRELLEVVSKEFKFDPNSNENEESKKCHVCGTPLEKWEIDKEKHPEQTRPSYYCPKCDVEMIYWDDGTVDVVS